MKLPICRHLNPPPRPGDEPYARLCSGCQRYVTWGGENVYTRQPGWVIDSHPIFKPKSSGKPGVYE